MEHGVWGITWGAPLLDSQKDLVHSPILFGSCKQKIEATNINYMSLLFKSMPQGLQPPICKASTVINSCQSEDKVFITNGNVHCSSTEAPSNSCRAGKAVGAGRGKISEVGPP